MDSRFSFLSAEDAHLIVGILARRDPGLAERVGCADSISRTDAQSIVELLGEVVSDHLGDDWEPDDYGREVGSAQARFNAARIAQWPN